MLERLLIWDQQFFAWFQDHLKHPLLDTPMHAVSQFEYFVPIIIPAALYLLWKGGPLGRRALVAALILVAITDPVSAKVLKPWFGRPRPFSESFGFPSSHASNIFAQALLWSLFYPRWLWFFFSIAISVGISRVYLGHHYALDVLGGAVFGGLCAWFIHRWAQRYAARIESIFQDLRIRMRSVLRIEVQAVDDSPPPVDSAEQKK